jgi:hypothetical protein
VSLDIRHTEPGERGHLLNHKRTVGKNNLKRFEMDTQIRFPYKSWELLQQDPLPYGCGDKGSITFPWFLLAESKWYQYNVSLVSHWLGQGGISIRPLWYFYTHTLLGVIWFLMGETVVRVGSTGFGFFS